MEISKMLTISTAHISEDTAKLLDEAPITNEMGVSIYSKANHGWFIHTPENIRELEDTTCPADLYACLLFTHKNGCDWLCLDANGECVDSLNKYEW